jgi:uncharacterized membrane protein
MLVLILGLVLFLGVHSVSIAAAGWRAEMITRLGDGTWKGIYSAVSLLGFLLILYGFGLARGGPVLYTPPSWLRHLALLFMLPVFPLLFAAYLPGRIKTAARHPMLAAVKFWALAHLLANGGWADVLLFGGFLAWAVADRISLKGRSQAPVLSAPPGPWNDAIAVGAGLVVYVITVSWLHVHLFGTAPLG